MHRPLKIAFVSPTSLPWMAQVVDGVRRYGLQFGGWQLLTCPPSLATSGERPRTLSSLIGWTGDGAIAAIRSKADREMAHQLGFPVVNLSTWEARLHGIPRVGVDNRLSGRLAAEYLLERGFRHFGYVGWETVHYSKERQAGFSSRIREEGFKVHVRLDDPEGKRHPRLVDDLKGLGDWLKSLPTPCAIFAVHDYRAELVMEACAHLSLRVPKDIAVIGMDDDALVCEHSNPTLTSVCRDSGGIGWEAAALIDRMVHGEDVSTSEILVPPEGITERQSTDLFHHPDELIQLAVAFMLRNLKDSPKIEAVARHTGVSKRTLEVRFKACMGKSPHQYLTEARIDQAKKILRRPIKQNLRQIATECGFSSYPSFVAAFQARVGQPPSHYRVADAPLAPKA